MNTYDTTEIFTADGHVAFPGFRVWCHYDLTWVTIGEDVDGQGWFSTTRDDGSRGPVLNGDRICTNPPAIHAADAGPDRPGQCPTCGRTDGHAVMCEHGQALAAPEPTASTPAREHTSVDDGLNPEGPLDFDVIPPRCAYCTKEQDHMPWRKMWAGRVAHQSCFALEAAEAQAAGDQVRGARLRRCGGPVCEPFTIPGAAGLFRYRVDGDAVIWFETLSYEASAWREADPSSFLQGYDQSHRSLITRAARFSETTAAALLHMRAFAEDQGPELGIATADLLQILMAWEARAETYRA